MLGLDPSGPAQRAALVPVPERTWALRNVANNMLRFGAAGSQAGEAVGMLREAAQLSADYYGATHPGDTSTLRSYFLMMSW